ncbi:MAG TPA: cation:proton antiporter [Polyangiales bacterium]|nr:cation:proton antiporter [Polyangiales bacterium]
MNHSSLLLQLVIILGTARLLGLVLRYFGQPAVIGEMAAGLILGPVVFGALAPELHADIFAPASRGPLEGLSQLGLVLFMFIVGAELRLPTGVRSQLVASGWIGVLSVILPLGMGFAIAYPLYPIVSIPGVSFWPFALFTAVAVSITAFPVMARILKDRNMTQTTVGRLGLTSAAVADVLAWFLLALVVVLASSKQDWNVLIRQLVGVLLLGAVIYGLFRPLIAWLLAKYASDGRPAGGLLATLLIGTFVCAYATDYLGVHAVFGAFLFGTCLPRDDRLLHSLIERIEHVAILVLMPVFFALAGLNTTSDAFVGAGLGGLALIMVVSIVGKYAGGVIGARVCRYSWRESFAVGSLMNARGLMELIVMKVGLDIGVIGQQMFTMLLVMALVTTVMTTPLVMLFTRNTGAVEERQTAR